MQFFGNLAFTGGRDLESRPKVGSKKCALCKGGDFQWVQILPGEESFQPRVVKLLSRTSTGDSRYGRSLDINIVRNCSIRIGLDYLKNSWGMRHAEKGPISRTPYAPGQLIGLSELKLDQTIPVWAGFSLHVLTKVF